MPAFTLAVMSSDLVRAASTERMQRLLAVIDDPVTLDVVCSGVTEGRSVARLCEEWDIPLGRFMGWLRSSPERWSAYNVALELWGHGLAAEAVSIADGPGPESDDKLTVARDKLRVDTRLKVAAAVAREAFGSSPPTAASPNSLTVTVNRMGVVQEGEWKEVKDGDA